MKMNVDVKRDVIDIILKVDPSTFKISDLKDKIKAKHPTLDVSDAGTEIKNFAQLVLRAFERVKEILSGDDFDLKKLGKGVREILGDEDGGLFEIYLPSIAKRYVKDVHRRIVYILIDTDFSKKVALETLLKNELKESFPEILTEEAFLNELESFSLLAVGNLNAIRMMTMTYAYAPSGEDLTPRKVYNELRKRAGDDACVLNIDEVGVFMRKCYQHILAEQDYVSEIASVDKTPEEILLAAKKLFGRLYSTEKILLAYIRREKATRGDVGPVDEVGPDEEYAGLVEKALSEEIDYTSKTRVYDRYQRTEKKGRGKKGDVVTVMSGIVTEKADRPYICNVCGDAFSTGIDLHDHKKRHFARGHEGELATAASEFEILKELDVEAQDDEVTQVSVYNLVDEDEERKIARLKRTKAKHDYEWSINYVGETKPSGAEGIKNPNRLNFGYNSEEWKRLIKKYKLDLSIKLHTIESRIRVYDIQIAYENKMNMRIGPFGVLYRIGSGRILKRYGERIPIAYQEPRYDEQPLSPDRKYISLFHVSLDEILTSLVTADSPLRDIFKKELARTFTDILIEKKGNEVVLKKRDEVGITIDPTAPDEKWTYFFENKKEWKYLRPKAVGDDCAKLITPLLNVSATFTKETRMSDNYSLKKLTKYVSSVIDASLKANKSPPDHYREILDSLGAFDSTTQGYKIAHAIYQAVIGPVSRLKMVCPTDEEIGANGWTVYFTDKYAYLLGTSSPKTPQEVLQYIKEHLPKLLSKKGVGLDNLKKIHEALLEISKERWDARIENGGDTVSIPESLDMQVRTAFTKDMAASNNEFILYQAVQAARIQIDPKEGLLDDFELARLIYYSLNGKSIPKTQGLQCPRTHVPWVSYFKSYKAWLNPKGENTDPERVLARIDMPQTVENTVSAVDTETDIDLLRVLDTASASGELPPPVVRLRTYLHQRLAANGDAPIRNLELAANIYRVFKNDAETGSGSDPYANYTFEILDYPLKSWEDYYSENLRSWYAITYDVLDVDRERLWTRATTISSAEHDPLFVIRSLENQVPGIFALQTDSEMIEAIKVVQRENPSVLLQVLLQRLTNSHLQKGKDIQRVELVQILTDAVLQYIKHYTSSVDMIYSRLLTKALAKKSNQVVVPSSKKKEYDRQYLSTLQKNYKAYRDVYEDTQAKYEEKIEKEREKREKAVGLTDDKITDLHFEIEQYENALFQRHGDSVQSYLMYGSLPLMFGDVAGLGVFAKFFKSKIRSKRYSVANLNSATLAHYIPELFMRPESNFDAVLSDAEFDRRMDLITKYMWIYTIRLASKYLEILDITRKKTKLPLIPAAEPYMFVTVKEACGYATSPNLEDVPLEDVAICFDGTMFTCHSPGSVLKDINVAEGKAPRNPYTGKKYPKEFIEKIKKAYEER